MGDAKVRPLSWPTRLRLALRVWRWLAIVRLGLSRHPLPELVASLGHPPRLARDRHPVRRLSRAVDRSLGFAGGQATCLVRALVLYRLLREQGDPAEVVIGLPPRAPQPRAHAWVELGGLDVGPPPGRGDHVPLARFR